MEDALRAWMSERDDRSSDACIDVNDLAAFAIGRMLDEERERIEAHVVTCSLCRAAVTAAVRAEAHLDAEAPRLRRSSRGPWFAVAAAVVLLAVGLAFLASRPGAPESKPTLDTAWASLANAHPDLFGDIDPLSAVERRRPGAALQRGSLRVEAPRGVVLEARPTVQWAGEGAARIRVSTADGRPLESVAGTSSPWAWPDASPPLPRGETYLVEIEAEGVLGLEQASTTFAVASDALVLLYMRRSDAVRDSIDAPLRELVLSHLALRADLLAEARRHAEAYLEARPEDEIGRETLFQVLTREGRSDIDHLLESPK